MNERERLMQKIAQNDFAVIELHIFLDTHPNDAAAAAKLEEYRTKSDTLRAEYVEKYGPIKASNVDANRWAWISNPWPWDIQGEGNE